MIKKFYSLVIKELQKRKIAIFTEKRAPPNGCFTALKNDREQPGRARDAPGNAFPGTDNAQRCGRRVSAGAGRQNAVAGRSRGIIPNPGLLSISLVVLDESASSEEEVQ